MRKTLGLLCMMVCFCSVTGAYALDEPVVDAQISEFVRRIFQDKRGDLWFGTNGDGVIRYDGGFLEYFSIGEGFGGVCVGCM